MVSSYVIIYSSMLDLNSLRPNDAYMRKFNIIVLDNGLSPSRRQAIIWTIARILLCNSRERTSVNS